METNELSSYTLTLPHINAVDDPLMGCLVQLTKLFNKPYSVETLKAGLPLVDNRLTPELFIRAAERADIAAQIIKRPLSKLSNLVLPTVLLLKNAQASILLHMDFKTKTARLLQPEAGAGEQTISLSDLEKEYTGYSIFVKKLHHFDERSPEIITVPQRHWFWSPLLQSWRIYRDVLVASLLLNVFAIASPLFIMNVYDRVVPNKAIDTLWVLALGMLVVFVFDFIFRALRHHFIEVAGKKADILLSATIFERMLGLKLEARPPSVGAFANNLGEFEHVRNFITSSTIAALIDAPFVLLFIAIIAFVGGHLAWVSIVMIPLMLGVEWFIQTPLKQAVENTSRAAAQKNAVLIETLVGAETIKILGAEGPLQRKWEQSIGYIAQWSLHLRELSAIAQHTLVFLQQLASVAVVIVGVYLIADLKLSMGALVACVMLTSRAISPIAQVARLITQYQQAKMGLKTLDSIMSLPIERPVKQSFIHRNTFKGQIEFEHVNFSYPGQTSLEVLSDISFHTQPGEKIAIIGRIGSGKTTLEKLIMNLYQPSSGTIRIDGIDIRQIDPAELRRSIGCVPQDILLFFGTLRENIVYGAPYVDDKAILRAADLAGITDFVNRHPLGFDMPVGEWGGRLSGGQRQSVAIARALLLDPPILILDEPTNSMDNSTEDALKQKFMSMMQNKTLILITHKASMLDLVDRVIVLDEGRIRADGPKKEVLEALHQGKLRVRKRS